MRQKRNTVMLSISGVLVAGFLLTSLASYFVSFSALREQIVKHELPLTGDSVYSEVQRDLLRPVYLSSLMSHDTFLRDWVVQGEKDVGQVTRYLSEIQRKYGTFTCFFVSEKTRTYYQSEGILKTVHEDDERDRWYFRVRSMEQPYELNVDPDMANDDALTIFINYRVYDQEGNFIGATGIGLTVYAVRDILARYRQEYGCTVLFADAKGQVVLREDGGILGDGATLQELPGLQDIAADILASKEHALSCNIDGGMVHVNSRLVDELGWHLVALQPEATKMRGIRHALFVNLGVCVIITSVVLLLLRIQLTAYQKRIERMATTDPLTGLHNRQAFDVLYDSTMADCARRGVGAVLLILDLDRFKEVNDTHGHVVGDEVLTRIARVLRASIRASDALCRWGGEEFLVMLRDCSLAEGVRVAEKIRKAVGEATVRHKSQEIRTTVSIGVTAIMAGEAVEVPLHRADRALYSAKENGRNRVEQG